MKTQVIKIDSDADYIYLNVDGVCNKRWNKPQGPISKELSDEAKVAAFDLLWQMTEMGSKVVINPYMN